MNTLKSFIYEEDGMGTIEIAIIVAALVALAIIFRKQIADIWKRLSSSLQEKETKVGDTSDFVKYKKNGSSYDKVSE